MNVKKPEFTIVCKWTYMNEILPLQNTCLTLAGGMKSMARSISVN